MDWKRTGMIAARAHDRAESRLSLVALFLAMLVLAGGLARVTGPNEPPALDPQTLLVGP